MKSAERFSVNPRVVHTKCARPERLDVLNEATIDSGAIEQLEDQAINRLLIAVLEEYEDLDTTQKENAKKTTAKMLPSTKHCMCTICVFVVMIMKCES